MLTERFEDALVYATRLHATQLRKGTTVPYVSHLLGVASLVLEHDGTEDEAIGGLLHDALEDQAAGGKTRSEILHRYGPDVLAIVEGCSDSHVDESASRLGWRVRKEAYLQHLARAPLSVRRVSACDKLYNARAIVVDYAVLGEALWSRFTGGKTGTLWYYAALVTAFAQHGELLALQTELARTVGHLEAMARSVPSAAEPK